MGLPIKGGVKEGSFWIEGDFEEMGTWLHNPPTSDQGVFLTHLGKTCLEEGGLDLMGFFCAYARNCYQHTILLLWITRVRYFPENRYICSKIVHIKTTSYESENSIMLIKLIINMRNKTFTHFMSLAKWSWHKEERSINLKTFISFHCCY